jgi:hypothetical protein
MLLSARLHFTMPTGTLGSIERGEHELTCISPTTGAIDRPHSVSSKSSYPLYSNLPRYGIMPGFLKTPFQKKNGKKLTSEQQLNQYEAPAQIFTKEKTVPKVREDQPELDEEQQRRVLNSSTEYVRRVRELIREKYRLDVYVWSKRDTLESNRNLIMESGKRSDDILSEIYTIVSAWDRDLFKADEWMVVKEIRAGVLRCIREDRWQAVPPWSRLSSGRRGVGA